MSSGDQLSIWGLKYVMSAAFNFGIARSFRHVVGLHDPPRNTWKRCPDAGLKFCVARVDILTLIDPYLRGDFARLGPGLRLGVIVESNKKLIAKS